MRSTSAPRPAASPTACSSAGAAHVVALDVAYGELDWRLRTDPRVTVIERTNARDLEPSGLPYAPGPDRRRRLVHLAGQGAAGRAGLRRVPRSTAWRSSSRSSRSGASASGRAGSSATRDARRDALRRGGRRGRGARRLGRSASRPRAFPVRRATSRRFVWLAEAGRAGGRGPRGRRAGGRAVSHPVGDRLHAPPPRRRRGGVWRPCARRRPRPACSCASTPRRRRRHELEPGEGVLTDAPVAPRRRPLRRARRRRHDPARAAELRRHRGAGVRGQLRRGRLPRHGRPRRPRGRPSSARCAATSKSLSLPAIEIRGAWQHR